ncbi:MAG: dipeptidase [bacterium]|nr:dipeptidase [bacterium]
MSVDSYISDHQEKFLEGLFTFLRFPTISTSVSHQKDLIDCCEWLANHARSLSFEKVQVHQTKGHPILTGELRSPNPSAPTILVYGHYDVQPVDPLHLWRKDPFEPFLDGDRIIARGAADDKGQVWMHFCSIETYLAVYGSLPVNIKLLIEGEEEIGSVHLIPFIKEHKQELSGDVFVISDTGLFADELPTICDGLRGLVYFEVDLYGPNRDLHSGTYGGSIDNPAFELARLISRLKTDKGVITIPGFYDHVRGVPEDVKALWATLPFDEDKYCMELGVHSTSGESGFTTLERLWARPTLEVNGLLSGFVESGAKTVLPAKAHCKISCRLVPDQEPKDIERKFVRFVQELCPPGCRIEIKLHHGGKPVLVDRNNRFIQAGKRALRDAFQKEPVFVRAGGSIPIVAAFKDVLNLDSVLLGFSQPNENAHSPNEWLSLKHFIYGVRSLSRFWGEAAK